MQTPCSCLDATHDKPNAIYTFMHNLIPGDWPHAIQRLNGSIQLKRSTISSFAQSSLRNATCSESTVCADGHDASRPVLRYSTNDYDFWRRTSLFVHILNIARLAWSRCLHLMICRRPVMLRISIRGSANIARRTETCINSPSMLVLSGATMHRSWSFIEGTPSRIFVVAC